MLEAIVAFWTKRVLNGILRARPQKSASKRRPKRPSWAAERRFVRACTSGRATFAKASPADAFGTDFGATPADNLEDSSFSGSFGTRLFHVLGRSEAATVSCRAKRIFISQT